MKILKTIGIIAAILLLLSGCTTTSPKGSPITDANYYFQRFNDRITPNNSVAILSYATSSFYRRGHFDNFDSMGEIEEFFSAYFDNMVARGTISDNYPTKATAEEMHVVRVFVDDWFNKVVKEELTVTDAYYDFRAYSIAFIGIMQSFEYDDRSIKSTREADKSVIR